MSIDHSQGPAGLQIGKLPRGSFVQLRCDEPVPFAPTVETSAGHLLARDPVGFPHVVVLRCPPGVLPEAGRLRLMKSFALAAGQVQSQSLASPEVLHLELVVDAQASEQPRAEPGPRYTVSPEWLEQVGSSLTSLRRAALALVETEPGLLVAPALRPVQERTIAGAQVLLFKNIFTLDVDSGVSRQINPGMHYLISPLVAEGVDLLLLDGKLPLQDVCERPPEADQVLLPADFLTDPGELDKALADNPRLNLVCLTLLERSFTQIRELCSFIRARSSAFIAIGGVLPTVLPEHAFAHLPLADFVVRGDGEGVLPELVRVVAGRTRVDGLDDAGRSHLARLEGVLAREDDRCVSVRIDRVNRVRNLDDSLLDFSIFERANVEHGLSLSTSRGCVYSCRFCSVMDKTCWRGKSVDAVMRDLVAYEQRLVALYGSAEAVPDTARRLQIWDDDLFLDPDRAAALLGRLVEAGFTATFIQGTVASFYRREGKRVTRQLNESLIDAIPRRLFTDHGGLKLGTESFNDAELRRLGKPYDYDRVRRLVLALGRRGIRQEHFRILCGRDTSLAELLDNLEKIAELRWAVGPGFSVLEPSWLMNLFPTALYRACQVQGTDLDQPTSGALTQPGYGELDYPFVLPERPVRREVFEVVRRFPSGMHYGMAGEPDWMFDGVYREGDLHYLRVFAYVRRALRQRLEALDRAPSGGDRAERFRVAEVLADRLGGELWVPLGLAGRLAPGLVETDGAAPPASSLADYVRSLVAGASDRGELDTPPDVRTEPHGVVLEVTRDGVSCRFLVQRYTEGAPCAFRSRNLAVIVQSSVKSETQRNRLKPLMEHIRALVQKHDTDDLA